MSPRTSRPCWEDEFGHVELLGFINDVYKEVRCPPHLETLTTQAGSLKRKRGVHLEEEKQSILVLWSYTILGWILYRGSLTRFYSPQWSPRINISVFFVFLFMSLFQ